ncbi:hypothetical protein PoB_004981900 [Plakobranchus ocellatus]|uniref:Uncharacterized protein n=1 Tax=Plakobranchus ocellatus TaxID=259542 RepID=A0AAV4BT11_9GAST|nr:hypothetical protein PoB_004981900 [Plakobranchus ocellatus]
MYSPPGFQRERPGPGSCFLAHWNPDRRKCWSVPGPDLNGRKLTPAPWTLGSFCLGFSVRVLFDVEGCNGSGLVGGQFGYGFRDKIKDRK